MGWFKTSRSVFLPNTENASYTKGENKHHVRKKKLQINTVALNGKELTKAHLIRKHVQQILVTDPTCHGETLVTDSKSFKAYNFYLAL